jgi:hypothetical protein
LIAKLVADGNARLAELQASTVKLNEMLEPQGLFDVQLPEAESVSVRVRGESALPPLANSSWDLLLQARVLKAHKAYRETLDLLDEEW